MDPARPLPPGSGPCLLSDHAVLPPTLSVRTPSLSLGYTKYDFLFCFLFCFLSLSFVFIFCFNNARMRNCEM